MISHGVEFAGHLLLAGCSSAKRNTFRNTFVCRLFADFSGVLLNGEVYG